MLTQFVGLVSTLDVVSTNPVAYDEPLVVHLIAQHLLEYHARQPVTRIRFWETNSPQKIYTFEMTLVDGRKWKQKFHFLTDTEHPPMSFETTDNWRRYELDGIDDIRRDFVVLRARYDVTDFDWKTL